MANSEQKFGNREMNDLDFEFYPQKWKNILYIGLR